MLRIHADPAERALAARGPHVNRDQRLERGDIPYCAVRSLYRRLAPDDRAHVLDLGSGYGRLGLYGGALLGVRFTGIEIVPERARAARRAAAALGLGGVEFEVGDALAAPWPHATCICWMNSFLPRQTPDALARLRDEARPGTVVAGISTVVKPLSREDWLEELPRSDGPLPVRLLRLYRVR